jgi:hypothetical protein
VNQTIKSDKSDISEVVGILRSIAVNSLARMYRPEKKLFSFRLRKKEREEILEGISRRYTAIALIGMAGEDRHITSEVLKKHSPQEVCERLLDDCGQSQELGEVALTIWAARVLGHKNAKKALTRLKLMEPTKGLYRTVELSWALTALVAGDGEPADVPLAKKIADSLMDSFNSQSAIFPHTPTRQGLSSLRSHVSCFADFVYPIQALSNYYKKTADSNAVEIADRCAECMCKLQGPQGQWWWHYDVRTGRIVEHYPVYSVHQDSMAPMALFALADACGKKDYSEAIEKSLNWLTNPPEIQDSLIDRERNVIWRKIARREPFKLVRKMQAVASYLHPAFRMPGADFLFPAVSIDYESRPYHMGWILYAWPVERTMRDN